MTEPTSAQPSEPTAPVPPSTSDAKTDPYARRRDDWPAVITNPDYAIPTPRR